MSLLHSTETKYVNCNLEEKPKYSNVQESNNIDGVYFTNYYTNTISKVFKIFPSSNSIRTSLLYDENGYAIATPDTDPANVRYLVRNTPPHLPASLERGVENMSYLNCQNEKTLFQKIKSHKRIIAGLLLFILILVVFILGLTLGLKAKKTRFCLEKDIEYEGGYLGEKSYISLEECQNFCLMEDDCKAFTYRFSDGNTQSFCWTKKVVAKKKHRTGVVSGTKNCSNN